MSTNISKKKRDDLLDKIKQIRAFIAAAPQDENTGNLLSYLSELEKDVNGKKYGLVFEEHREEIDEVLDTHTPVLTEDADLFIDHGGQMNFLLEGDNLAALKLLEKTHRGKIDLIYIDPPYNRGKTDFVYDDDFVVNEDTFRHSKWISFMKSRLEAAKRLLTEAGLVFISIDDNEVGMEYSFMNTIIRKLFDKNFNYAHKILALEPREVYAFVLNNADRLRHLVREAMAAEMAQMQLDVQTKSLQTLLICGIFVVQMRCLESLMDLRGLQRHFPRKAPLVKG